LPKEGETEVVATEEGEKSGCLQRLICQICFLAAGQSDQEWQPASYRAYIKIVNEKA
jgi:hypothetical protein